MVYGLVDYSVLASGILPVGAVSEIIMPLEIMRMTKILLERNVTRLHFRYSLL